MTLGTTTVERAILLPSWQHLSGLPWADPGYGKPGRIDLLLGVEVFVDVLLNGRQTGPPGSPVALETKFG